MTMIKVLFMLCACLAISLSFGQIGGNEEDFSLNVHGEGKRTIVPPSKISVLPEIKEEAHEKPLVKYTILPKKIEVSFLPEPIKPARLKVSEPLEKLYGGYLKAGFGNYIMPLLDFYYSGTRSRQNNWGINLKHFSAGQGPDDVGFSGFSENALKGSYKQFLDYHTLSFDAGYERNVAHFYGFQLTDSIFSNFKDARDEIKTIYNKLYFSSVLESKYKDSAKINHKIGLNYYYFQGNFENRENQFVLDGRLQKYFGKELARFDFSLDYNDYAHQRYEPLDTNQLISSLSPAGFNVLQNSVILKLTPSINALRKNFKASIGASIQIDSKDGNFHLFPRAEVKYSMFNNMFIPYAGATGDVNRNSFSSMTSENPFASSAMELTNTVKRYELYGGIRGSFSSSMSFNLKVSQARYTEMPLFYNDTLTSLQNQFNVVYDHVNMATVGGQLSYRLDEKIKIYLRADYRNYKMDYEAFAWHMPSLELSVGGVYKLADKVVVKADLFYLGKRYAKSPKPVTGVSPIETTNIDGVEEAYYPVELKAIFDANLGIEYRLTQKFSAFVNVNNLTTKKYQQWLRYPSQSINLLFGATARF